MMSLPALQSIFPCWNWPCWQHLLFLSEVPNRALLPILDSQSTEITKAADPASSMLLISSLEKFYTSGRSLQEL